SALGCPIGSSLLFVRFTLALPGGCAMRSSPGHHGRWPFPRQEGSSMSALRQRFLDDLRLRNYSPRTLETYLQQVVRFSKYFGRSPAALGPEEIRAYQLYLLHERHVSWSVFNQAVCALRFLYRVTLQASFAVTLIPYGKRPKTLPTVLS